MAQMESKVRSQLISLAGLNLVLPTTSIAEVIGYTDPQPSEGGPDWLLGFTEWRGVRIPLISFEAANGGTPAKPDRRSRIVVLNGIGGDEQLPFFGMVVQGIPRLMQLDTTSISAIAPPETTHPLALQHTLVQEQEAVIPNQDKLENMLKQHGITATQLSA